MKLYTKLLLAICCVFYAILANADEFENHPDTMIMDLKTYSDTLFGQIDMSQVPSGILTDVAMRPFPVYELDNQKKKISNKLTSLSLHNTAYPDP